MNLSRWTPDFRKSFVEQTLLWLFLVIASGFGTLWAKAQTTAPAITSVGWLVVFVVLAFSVLAIAAMAGWTAGWIKRQWVTERSSTESTARESTITAKRDAAEMLVLKEPRITNYEREQKLQALDVLLALLRESPHKESSALKERLAIIRDGWDAFRSPGIQEDFSARLSEFKSKMVSLRDKLRDYQKANEAHSDLRALASDQHCNQALSAMKSLWEAWVLALDTLRDHNHPEKAFSSWIGPRIDEAQSTLEHATNWSISTRNIALDMRKALAEQQDASPSST